MELKTIILSEAIQIQNNKYYIDHICDQPYRLNVGASFEFLDIYVLLGTSTEARKLIREQGRGDFKEGEMKSNGIKA